VDAVDEFTMGFWISSPEIVQLLIVVSGGRVRRRSTWARDVSVEVDEVEEGRNLGVREVQCGEMMFECCVRAAFMSSSGRLR
jgi:hypothetical protein